MTTDQLNYDVAKLAFHGVDTIAFIELNDSPVGSTNNMFVRYVFDIKPHLKVGIVFYRIDGFLLILACYRRERICAKR